MGCAFEGDSHAVVRANFADYRGDGGSAMGGGTRMGMKFNRFER